MHSNIMWLHVKYLILYVIYNVEWHIKLQLMSNKLPLSFLTLYSDMLYLWELLEAKIHRSYKIKPKETASVEIWCRSNSVIFLWFFHHEKINRLWYICSLNKNLTLALTLSTIESIGNSADKLRYLRSDA